MLIKDETQLNFIQLPTTTLAARPIETCIPAKVFAPSIRSLRVLLGAFQLGGAKSGT